MYISFIIEFHMFFLGFFVALRKHLCIYTKVTAIKNTLRLRYSLFLRYQEMTLIEVTSWNLSHEIQKSKDLALLEDVR